MMRTLALLALVPAASRARAATASPPATNVASPVTLGVPPECGRAPQARPATVELACDANATAKRLSWPVWGGPTALARGVVSVNACTPDCAAAYYREFPAVLVADGRQRCPGGGFAYARITVAWLGRSPYPKRDEPLVAELACGDR